MYTLTHVRAVIAVLLTARRGIVLRLFRFSSGSTYRAKCVNIFRDSRRPVLTGWRDFILGLKAFMLMIGVSVHSRRLTVAVTRNIGFDRVKAFEEL